MRDVAALAARAPLDEGNIVECKLHHGHSLLEDMLDQVPGRACRGNDPHPEQARPVLNDLQISYLIPD